MNEIFDALGDKTSADLYMDGAIRSIEDAREALAKSDPQLKAEGNAELARHLQLALRSVLNLRDELKRPRVEETA